MHSNRVHSFTLYRMTFPKLSDILEIIDKKYSFSISEKWDNSGLQLGEPANEIRRIMVALDPLPAVIDEAISLDCQLLVAHHPLLFTPLSQINGSTCVGSSVLKAARNNLAVIAMHTNYDIAEEGLNDLLASLIGLKQTLPLKKTDSAELSKLVSFIPVESFETVRQALLPYTESTGNYIDCSFSCLGEGTFLPLEGAKPAIGTIGNLEKLQEKRLELLVRRDSVSKMVQTLLKVHPYQEPAFDCYPLLNETKVTGIGRVGAFPEPSKFKDIAASVGRKLGCTAVRMVGEPERIISTVALCTGSGGSMITEAVKAGADLFITGDIRYHEARDAEALGLALLDAGHFATERIMVDAVAKFLETSFAHSDQRAELFRSNSEQDPFKNVVIEELN